jgi:hypothetical protein
MAERYESRRQTCSSLRSSIPLSLPCNLAGQGATLELGIGTGRIALPLARRGVRVHGIDLSEGDGRKAACQAWRGADQCDDRRFRLESDERVVEHLNRGERSVLRLGDEHERTARPRAHPRRRTRDRLAYAGLRPGEALAPTWSHIRDRTILVERAVALGELKTTKTARTRTVRLLAPLAADLREWRIAQGRPAG